MFTESAELYDAIYAGFKDYAAEVERIAALLRSVNPQARSVLDVACGTGEHAARLAAAHGLSVDGLDLDPGLLRIARQKHPAGRFFEADMSDFALEQRYDVILCLFSSIGYLRTLDRVQRALECFRRHLNPTGIAVIEPWFAPGELDPSRTTRQAAIVGDLRIERSSRLEIDGSLSRLHFEYRIEGPAGVRHTTEVHELGLFTTTELTQAFQAAGLSPTFDPVGLTGRGLYVAQIAA
jgi:ubiquinone/menaquinone biosynthesis C-methylase UbiE